MPTVPPSIPLLTKPTPLEPLARLSAHLGGARIFIKRDDVGGRGGGGNKLRKFERQLAAAVVAQADTILLAAHPQSNAARELVGCAAPLGLHVVLAVKDLVPRHTPAFASNGNALLLQVMGARLVRVSADEDFPLAMVRIADELRAEGARVHVLPFGASDGLGALGYVDCAQEVLEQTRARSGREPDVMVVATGSGGTQAGLVAGTMNAAGTRVLGFTILKAADQIAPDVARLAKEALHLLGAPTSPEDLAARVHVDERARGDGYGHTTEASLEAIRLLARLEGVLLDPVYTGKAMAGLISAVRSGELSKDDIVVFVHTGGQPLLFAYADAFSR